MRLARPILLSTPGRCGTHWLERILRKCFARKKAKTLCWYELAQPMQSMCPNTTYLTHDPVAYFTPMLDSADFITVIRDPRDIVVSSAYYWASRESNEEWETLERYWGHLADYSSTFERMLALLKIQMHNKRWFDYWMRFKEVMPCYIVKYEDLYSNVEDTMCKLLSTLGYEIRMPVLHKAIADSAFVVMSGGREPGEEDVNDFHRKGVVGDWQEHFTSEENTEFYNRFGDIMREFGYE